MRREQQFINASQRDGRADDYAWQRSIGRKSCSLDGGSVKRYWTTGEPLKIIGQLGQCVVGWFERPRDVLPHIALTDPFLTRWQGWQLRFQVRHRGLSDQLALGINEQAGRVAVNAVHLHRRSRAIK